VSVGDLGSVGCGLKSGELTQARAEIAAGLDPEAWQLFAG
jgi:hypothetical protein